MAIINELNLIIGIFNVIFGIFLLVFSLVLINEKLKMNNWIGFRYKQAYISVEAWYKINKYSGQVVLPWSIIAILLGVVFFFLPPINLFFQYVGIFAPLLILIDPTIRSFLYARRYEYVSNKSINSGA